MAMRSDYSLDYSPCCDMAGHKPAGSPGPYFCMGCGKTLNSAPAN